MKAALHILGIIALLAVASSLLPADSFWITDNGNRWIQMESFIRTGGESWIDYPARPLDPTLRFFPRGGHHFLVHEGAVASFYGTAYPGIASLLHPFLGDSVRIILPLTGTLLLLVVVAGVAPRFEVDPVRAVWLTTFATPVVFYSMTFWEHTLATGLVMLALWLAWKRTVPLLVGSGAVLGISIVLREEGYIVAGALLMFLLIERHWADVAAVGAGLVAILAIHWQSLLSVHGSILGPHISVYLGMEAHGSGVVSKLRDYAVYLFQFGSSPTLNLILVLPHIGIIPAIIWLARRREGEAPAEPSLRGNSLVAMLILLCAVSTFWFGATALMDEHPDLGTLERQGLFPALPLIVPAIVGAWVGLRNRMRESICAGLLIVFVVALTPLLLHSRDVGIIWGPRHFFHLFPLVTLLALAGLNALRKVHPARVQKIANVAVGAVVIGSVLIQAAGLRALVAKRVGSAEMVEAVARIDERIIATDVYWLPEELGAIFYDRLMMQARNDAEVVALLNQLHKGGVESFAFVTFSGFGSVSHGLLEQLSVDRHVVPVQILGGLEMTIFEVELAEITTER